MRGITAANSADDPAQLGANVVYILLCILLSNELYSISVLHVPTISSQTLYILFPTFSFWAQLSLAYTVVGILADAMGSPGGSVS